MALVPPIQSKAVDGGAGTSLSLAFTSNNTAGNLIVVCHSVTGVSPGDRVTDSRNTYGANAEDISDGSDATGGISSAPNCGAGANTVQISGAGSQTARNLHILEYAGLATSTPFDKTANNTGFGSGADALTAGPTAALAQASELVVAFGFAGGAAQSPYTSTAPLTERTDLAGGVIDSTVGDKEVSATTAVSVAFSSTGANNWGCIIATYKAVPAPQPDFNFRQRALRPAVFKPGLAR